MNHLAYFALEMTNLREREAEREIALRRKRIGDDDAPIRIRDRKWAAAIHRWATVGPRAATPAAPHTPGARASHPAPAANEGAAAPTLGRASACA